MTDKQAEKLRQAMAISDLLTLVDDGYVLGKNTIQEAGSLIFNLLHEIKMEDSPAQHAPVLTNENTAMCIKCNAWFSPQNDKQVYCKACDVKKKIRNRKANRPPNPERVMAMKFKYANIDIDKEIDYWLN